MAWVVEIFASQDKSNCKRYILRGSVCKLGRGVDNEISFPNDKSISRCHAELHLSKDSAKPELQVMDVGSTYGTSINGVKLTPKLSQSLSNGMTVSLGPTTKLRLLFSPFLLCITRLERDEKEKVKIVNQVAATAKFLTAVVRKIKLVSARWLEFMEETDKICVEIPPEDSFPPALNEEVSLLNPLSPRGSVLSDVQVVLLTDSSEEQYASILTACGATVVKIKEGVEFRSALDSAVKSLTADGIKCIFHDESVGVDLTRSVASYVKLNRSNTTSNSIQWLTSSQVAAAVMSLTTPTFSDDLRTSMSQVFAFSQQSDGRNSQSQFQVAHGNEDSFFHDNSQAGIFSNRVTTVKDMKLPMNPPLMPPTEGFAEPTNPSRMMERTLTLGGSEVFEATPIKEDTAVKRSFQHIEKPKEGAELELSSSKRRKVDVEPSSSSSSSTAMLTTKADRVYGKAVDKPLPVSDTINNPSAATSMVKPSSVTGGIATKQPTDSVAPTPATSNLGNPINKAIVVSNVPPELEFSVKEVVSGRGRKKAVPAPAPVDKVSEKGDPITAKSTIDKPPTYTFSNTGIPIAVEAAIPAAEAAIDAPLQLTATRKKAKKDTEVIGNPPTATATTLKDLITTTADVHTDRDKDGTRGSRSKGSPAASPLSTKATKSSARNAKPALALTTIEEDDHEVHRTSDMAAANSNSALTSIDDSTSRGSRSKPNKLSTTATATSTASQIDPPRQTNRRNQLKAVSDTMDGLLEVDGWCIIVRDDRPDYEKKLALMSMRENLIKKASEQKVRPERGVEDIEDVKGPTRSSSQLADEFNAAFIKPETVEKELVLRELCQNIDSFAISSNSKESNDKKMFKKNLVKSCPSSRILSSTEMVRVLPKESEREIQMRLDYEAAKLREFQAEDIFSAETGARLGRKK